MKINKLGLEEWATFIFSPRQIFQKKGFDSQSQTLFDFPDKTKSDYIVNLIFKIAHPIFCNAELYLYICKRLIETK